MPDHSAWSEEEHRRPRAQAQFSMSWAGPFKILVVGPSPVSDTPDGRPLERKLLYLDLLTDAQGPDSRSHDSALRCKTMPDPCDTEDIPTCLLADLSTYVLYLFRLQVSACSRHP